VIRASIGAANQRRQNITASNNATRDARNLSQKQKGSTVKRESNPSPGFDGLSTSCIGWHAKLHAANKAAKCPLAGGGIYKPQQRSLPNVARKLALPYSRVGCVFPSRRYFFAESLLGENFRNFTNRLHSTWSIGRYPEQKRF
jgi:hypothetical protein